MAVEKLTKNRTKDPARSVTCDFDMPDTLGDCVEAWGEEATYSLIHAAVRVRGQAVIDGGIAKGLSDEKIQERLSAWKPGITLESVGIDPVEAYKLMSPEEKRAFLARIGEIA